MSNKTVTLTYAGADHRLTGVEEGDRVRDAVSEAIKTGGAMIEAATVKGAVHLLVTHHTPISITVKPASSGRATFA